MAVKLILPKLSYKVVGVCMKVHNELGSSLLEKYYQRAIEKELGDTGLSFKREVPVEIRYKQKSIGRYFIDFVIGNKVVLELKAQKKYAPQFSKQVLAYLRQLDFPLGIIVNFRDESLSPHRVINSRWSGFDDSNKLEKKLE